jgi:hypothetical protein
MGVSFDIVDMEVTRTGGNNRTNLTSALRGARSKEGLVVWVQARPSEKRFVTPSQCQLKLLPSEYNRRSLGDRNT